MGLYNGPLPKIATEQIFFPWLSVIKRHECASILCLPRSDRHYRVTQFLKEYSEKISDTHCVVISLCALVTEVEAELVQTLDKLHNSKKSRTIFFILDGEWLLTAGPHIITVLQRYVLDTDRSTSFFVFFERNILVPEYEKLFVNCPSFLQNVMYHTLYSKDEIVHFVYHLAQLYACSIKKEFVENIYTYCGGYIWLTTEAVRHLHTTGKLSFDHDEMTFRLQSVWSGFTSQEQSVLSHVVQSEMTKNTPSVAQSYFTNMQLLEEKDDRIRITVPILYDFIRKKTQEERCLRVAEDGQLWAGYTLVSPLFSMRERAILSALLKTKGTVVLRDTIARFLWGDGWEDTYSDWAIDQAMGRLRRKMASLGIGKDVLRAKKGKGFIFFDTI